jgi:hypothetical protein
MKAVGWLPERFDSAIRESGQPKPSGGSTVKRTNCASTGVWKVA